MQAEAAAEVVGVTFEEEYSDRLPEWLITRAAELGYTNPTPVQQETLDTVLDGHDAIVQAKTGSGKTLAYLLPILANLKPTSSVQALVLLPTRELVEQVRRCEDETQRGAKRRVGSSIFTFVMSLQPFVYAPSLSSSHVSNNERQLSRNSLCSSQVAATLKELLYYLTDIIAR